MTIIYLPSVLDPYGIKSFSKREVRTRDRDHNSFGQESLPLGISTTSTTKPLFLRTSNNPSSHFVLGGSARCVSQNPFLKTLEMPAICTGPPSSDGCGGQGNAKSVVLSAVDAFRSFVNDFKDRKNVSQVPILSNRAVTAETKRVQAAQDYMAARLEGRNDVVAGLVADDIELTSSRDGKVVGKSHFREYIGRVKPTGSWKPATWNSSIGKAEVLGNVRILMVNVGVVAHFGFNRAGKINQIYVGTRRSAPE